MGMQDEHYQLLVAIVQEQDATGICDSLIAAGFAGPTRVGSAGGYLGQGNVTLLVGVQTQRMLAALRTIADHCQTRSQYVHPLPPIINTTADGSRYPLQVHIGGAVIFVLEVDRYERW